MVPPIAPKTAPPAATASVPQPRHMFVFGVGFVGRYVSERLLAQGWQVSGTCTSATKKRELEALGICASVFDARDGNMSDLHTLQDATHLLISIPPVSGIGDPLLNLNEDLKRILSHGNLQCLSTFHQQTESAKLRHTAEKGWLELIDDPDLSAFVFRLGGIYGPGRSLVILALNKISLIATLLFILQCLFANYCSALDTIAKSRSLSQKQKLRESKQYTARIHVADIYQAVLASMSIRCARKIINVVDDDPAPRAEVFAFARSLIESRYPDLISESVEVDSTGFGSCDRVIPAEKRVSNARLKQELGVKLLHPTYRSGLQSILDSWQAESKFPHSS
ncbi:hypothetical protein PR202_ga23928 [Eleusine coracana subsp. coracana]|uniref:Uncharacterized protein n=1 Tax=Eleusine coracana subsp. coracana TaxID=191504 RepID=A0AAV5D5I7_ELECO|nr:hypothetical protein PR202_ga23928 [Eleusine coracana subsp. coracana]